MTSLRGRSFLPTISARSADGVTGAVMPPRAPPAGLPAPFFCVAAVSSLPRFPVDRAIFHLRLICSIIDQTGRHIGCRFLVDLSGMLKVFGIPFRLEWER